MFSSRLTTADQPSLADRGTAPAAKSVYPIWPGTQVRSTVPPVRSGAASRVSNFFPRAKRPVVSNSPPAGGVVHDSADADIRQPAWRNGAPTVLCQAMFISAGLSPPFVRIRLV